MDLIVLLVSLDIIASKFLDCYTTTIGVQNIHLERKSLSRKIMEMMGMKYSIWLNFLLTILMVNIFVFLLYNSFSATSYQLLFIFTGLFMTAVNLGAAHSNYFGKKNFITETLLK